MALNYTYLKYKDTHTLKNTGTVDLTYHVSKVTCDATTEIKTGVITPNQTVVLTFATDGNYSIYLSSSTETSVPFTIKYYENLLSSFVLMAQQTICGTSSGGGGSSSSSGMGSNSGSNSNLGGHSGGHSGSGGKCGDCGGYNQCEDYLEAFMKAQAFNTINILHIKII